MDVPHDRQQMGSAVGLRHRPGQSETRSEVSTLLQAARVVKVSSHSGIELEQAAQAIATVNGPALRRYVRRRKEEKITFALVIAFKMMMFNVLSQCAA